MIPIDKIEKMEEFPKPFEYFKLSLKESFFFIFPSAIILLIVFNQNLLVIGSLLITYLVLITMLNYRFDKKIFFALKNKKS